MQKKLNLKKSENTLINCLSGGERRRLSFATEILTDPSILFFDEPTSGLDSFMAISIVESMRQLAQSGKTIVFTVHHPSSELVELIDNICLMSEGKLIFHGNKADASTFFHSQGFCSPPDYNPIDFYIKTISISPFDKQESLANINVCLKPTSWSFIIKCARMSLYLELLTWQNIKRLADSFKNSLTFSRLIEEINDESLYEKERFHALKSEKYRFVPCMSWTYDLICFSMLLLFFFIHIYNTVGVMWTYSVRFGCLRGDRWSTRSEIRWNFASSFIKIL